MSATVGNMSERDIRQHLSEQVRLAEMAWIAADDNAGRLEEGKAIIRDEMVNNLLAEGIEKSAAAAERSARTSTQFKGYIRKMHDARRLANEAKATSRALDRDYWIAASQEASERAQMRMAGAR